MLILAQPCPAIIVIGDQARNLSAPTGRFHWSGWEFQGQWGEFTGTAIGPHHFLTAKHVGGQVGDNFYYAGQSYESINYTVVPGADLAVWTVAGNLPYWAPLYEDGDEAGREVILYGRGTERGKPVLIEGQLRGWEWGPHDGRLSWGTSHVVAIIPLDMSQMVNGGAVTQMLAFGFEKSGGPNEGSVSSGDSGGGVFLLEGNEWKLAGINHGVTAAYSLAGFATLPAALFDAGGMFRPVENGMDSTTSSRPIPASTISLATRTSPFVPFLREVLREPPRRQFLTRRQGVLLLGLLMLLVISFFVARVRRRLREEPPTGFSA